MNPVSIYLLNACAMPGTLPGIEINFIKTNKQKNELFQELHPTGD